MAKETRQEAVYDFRRSLRFPAIVNQDQREKTQRQVEQKAAQSGALSNSPDSCGLCYEYFSESPSINRYDTDDCIILLQDDISELRHLALTLGIEKQRKSCDVLVREMNSKWCPVKESRGDRWWKHSKKWIRHNDEDMQSGHEAQKQNPNLTRTRWEEKIERESELSAETEREERDKDKAHDNLPDNIKEKIRSVAIPGIGCSYRLPVINRKQTK
jgi:hypothetical protein